MIDRSPTTTAVEKMEVVLLARHGPLLSSGALIGALGFRTAAAFRQARRRGQVGVRTFRIDGRRGTFALTVDVARWLVFEAGRNSERMSDCQSGEDGDD